MGVGHRLVFWRAQVGQQRGHLVEGPPAYGFMIPATKEAAFRSPTGAAQAAAPPLPHLLLERYWPILSWLFHSRRWRARTLPSLMKDRLWLTESLGGESDAMSKKNLGGGEGRRCVIVCVIPGADPEALLPAHLLAASKLLFTKSLKGLMCSSLVNRTWFAMLCRI